MRRSACSKTAAAIMRRNPWRRTGFTVAATRILISGFSMSLFFFPVSFKTDVKKRKKLLELVVGGQVKASFHQQSCNGVICIRSRLGNSRLLSVSSITAYLTESSLEESYKPDRLMILGETRRRVFPFNLLWVSVIAATFACGCVCLMQLSTSIRHLPLPDNELRFVAFQFRNTISTSSHKPSIWRVRLLQSPIPQSAHQRLPKTIWLERKKPVRTQATLW